MAISQQATRPTPPPKAAPCTRAMVGLGSSSRVRIRRARARESWRLSSSLAAAMPRIHCMSAPAENEAPSPASTTARTWSSRPAASRAAVSWAINEASNALCRAGRFNHRVSTEALRSIRSASLMGRFAP
ncbi:hypothetical protein D3C71_1707230 [compost metagenome]